MKILIFIAMMFIAMILSVDSKTFKVKEEEEETEEIEIKQY